MSVFWGDCFQFHSLCVSQSTKDTKGAVLIFPLEVPTIEQQWFPFTLLCQWRHPMTQTAAPTSVFAVANWFINKSLETKVPITHLKLQKLVYFSYGWYYACNEEPLFLESIQAWRHGPVIADLYGLFQGFGSAPVECLAERSFQNNSGDTVQLPYTLPDDPEVSRTILEALETVWDTYSPYTASQLRGITHRDESPWSNAWKTGGRKVVIEPTEIFKYFVGLYDRYEQALNTTV
jgi:uncharacterized phage-associated protein